METVTETSTAPELRARFNATFLRWVSPALAKIDIRYYLSYFCITPHPSGKGVWIIATNGHMMLVAWDESGTASEQMVVTVSPTGIRTISKNHRDSRDSQASVCEIVGTRLTLLNKHGDEVFLQPGNCHLKDKTYPDWQRVAPPNDRAKLVPGSLSAIQSNYITTALSQMPNPESGIYSPIKFWQSKQEIENVRAISAAYLEIVDMPILGIFMPIRTDYDGSDAPCSFTKLLPSKP